MEDKFFEFLKKCIKIIMDNLQTCLESTTLATGKRMVKVLVISLIILSFSIISEFCGWWTFVSWKEAFTCVILSIIICLADTANRRKISKFKNQIRGGINHGKRR